VVNWLATILTPFLLIAVYVLNTSNNVWGHKYSQTVCTLGLLLSELLCHMHGGLRIIESLRLQKTSKIIKSNHQPNTTVPAKPYPEVPYLRVF